MKLRLPGSGFDLHLSFFRPDDGRDDNCRDLWIFSIAALLDHMTEHSLPRLSIERVSRSTSNFIE
jgi:hypothetical protein